MNPALAKPLLVAGVFDALLGVCFGAWAASGSAPRAMWVVAAALCGSGLALVYIALRRNVAGPRDGTR